MTVPKDVSRAVMLMAAFQYRAVKFVQRTTTRAEFDKQADELARQYNADLDEAWETIQSHRTPDAPNLSKEAFLQDLKDQSWNFIHDWWNKA